MKLPSIGKLISGRYTAEAGDTTCRTWAVIPNLVELGETRTARTPRIGHSKMGENGKIAYQKGSTKLSRLLHTYYITLKATQYTSARPVSSTFLAIM